MDYKLPIFLSLPASPPSSSSLFISSKLSHIVFFLILDYALGPPDKEFFHFSLHWLRSLLTFYFHEKAFCDPTLFQPIQRYYLLSPRVEEIFLLLPF